MTSIDLPRRDNTLKSLFNPLRTDFTVFLRDDDNKPQEYKIRSMEIETFPSYIADIIIKKLVTAIQNERNIDPIKKDEEEKIVKEIVV